MGVASLASRSEADDVREVAERHGGNALAGTIGTTTLHGGRSRVRVGELLAECPTGEAAALERGATAYAVFAPEDVRVIPLDRTAPANDEEDPG
jgi:hypothetical protein